MKNNKNRLIWLIPITLFLIIVPFTPLMDLSLSTLYYSQETHTFQTGRWLDFMYEWGVFPGQLLIAGSLATLFLSYSLKRFKSWRTPSLYLVLTLATGAGFITHALLKDQWGRPRPRQVITYGGSQEYRPIWKPNFFNQPEPSKSFPCGHCTMGFAFFTFYFLGKRLKNKWLSIFGITFSLLLGIGLGITRIAQGGHFFSDVITTALILWFSAFAFDWLLYTEENI